MATTRTGKPIIIADYDSAWVEKFVRERERIFAACGRDAFVRIEHIGSTAVPGLAAKPIVDMMPGLRSLDDATPLIPLLEAIGWQYASEAERPTVIDEGMPFRRYFRKDEDGKRAFHMHMVAVTSEFWRDHLAFRNYLRWRPVDAAEYARTKRGLLSTATPPAPPPRDPRPPAAAPRPSSSRTSRAAHRRNRRCGTGPA